jgi:hypothetical protein
VYPFLHQIHPLYVGTLVGTLRIERSLTVYKTVSVKPFGPVPVPCYPTSHTVKDGTLSHTPVDAP